jgi:hypothetical protein
VPAARDYSDARRYTPRRGIALVAALAGAAETRAPSLAWRAAARIATFAAIVALALVLAYWIWNLIAPAPVRIPAAVPTDPGATLAASGLFRSGGASTPSTQAGGGLGSDARLLGVFAGQNGDGYALFRLSSGPKLVARGQEIVPGAVLAAVNVDSVSVREKDGERALVLRATSTGNAAKSTSASPPAQAGAKAAAQRQACAPPAGFKGQTVQLNAELLGGLISAPETWRTLVQPANGALVVTDGTGFAAMLGLAQGDRLEQANGIALAAPDDVTTAVLKPLQANQGVRVTGSRSGQPRELWLVNVGACAR